MWRLQSSVSMEMKSELPFRARKMQQQQWCFSSKWFQTRLSPQKKKKKITKMFVSFCQVVIDEPPKEAPSMFSLPWWVHFWGGFFLHACSHGRHPKLCSAIKGRVFDTPPSSINLCTPLSPDHLRLTQSFTHNTHVLYTVAYISSPIGYTFTVFLQHAFNSQFFFFFLYCRLLSIHNDNLTRVKQMSAALR